jgi:2-succinyl-5-enolpyruvyl-6-hydroxy-3-cyclohexene-1-carboxylate synthase
MRISNKTVVQSLLFLLQERGIQNIVYSPGSRNAPFAIALDGHDFFNVHIKVDERSAAFFALGMAQQLKKPVALICTSGTAPLNYAPAIAEAFYQEIPLIAITADRPAESINQSEGQCIDQIGIYDNFIKAQSCAMEEANGDEDVQANHLLLAQTLNNAILFPQGPVHINVPFKEPLYTEVTSLNHLTQIPSEQPRTHVAPHFPVFRIDWKYLVLMGQNNDDSCAEMVQRLSKWKNVLILTETHSNAHDLGGVDCIDRWIMSLSEAQIESLHWDVVVSLGHNIISRKIKALIKTKAKAHWSIQWQTNPIDTYRLNPEVFQCSIRDFVQNWLNNMDPTNALDCAKKPSMSQDVNLVQYFSQRPFSDLKLFYHLSQSWPQGAQIQMGNSSVVRYIQLFEQRRDVRFFGNRGVSGIDGSTSTAVGAALMVNQPVVFVTGDLSFLYDANGLWHQPWPTNLKVVVVDNGGGGIFKIIDGAKREPSVPRFFETPHQRDLLQWIKGWGLQAIELIDPNQEALENFFVNDNCQVLVVKTQSEVNPIELDLFFEYFKQQNERVENN